MWSTEVAEEVPYEQLAPADGRPVFYLSYHAVIREDKQTTKTRVVFDASARDFNCVSKQLLRSGPCITPRFGRNSSALQKKSGGGNG